MDSSGGRRITTEEAVLKTATVEVKTLTLSGKQMTLAVFRQLIDEQVITITGDDRIILAGEPWGVINYHSGLGCDGFKESAHIHVVWQCGNELRRACERPISPKCVPTFIVSLLDVFCHRMQRYALALSLTGWRPDRYADLHPLSFIYRDGEAVFAKASDFPVVDYASLPSNTRFPLKLGNETAYIAVTNEMAACWNAVGGLNLDHSLAVKARYDQLLRIGQHVGTVDEWEMIASDAGRELTSRKARCSALYESLTKLDQLFIAV